jgi:hypothetical protein
MYFIYIFFIYSNIIIIGGNVNKQESFKEFISKHPNVIEYVKSKEMTFQDLYEIYDIYGESDSVWDKYFNRSSNEAKLSELASIFKNINIDNIEHHINTAQKAIGIIQELTKKNPTPTNVVDKPINNIFGD